jgi:hypothetical protein
LRPFSVESARPPIRVATDKASILQQLEPREPRGQRRQSDILEGGDALLDYGKAAAVGPDTFGRCWHCQCSRFVLVQP